MDKLTAMILVSSSVNVSKYGFFTSKDALPKTRLLKKPATTKRFEYSPLTKKIKAQIDIGNKQYQALNKLYEIDETKNKKQVLKNCSKSDLIYDSNYRFYKYYFDFKIKEFVCTYFFV